MNSAWWQGKKGEWYVVFQFVLFGILFIVPFLTDSWAGWPPPWNNLSLMLGLLLAMLGLVLAFAGLISLGRNLTAVPHPKEDARLVVSGAYRLVRHPIYSGIILGAFGWGFLSNSLITLLLAIVLFLFFDVKSRREEKWLAAKYADYNQYQKHTRKLIPFLY